MLAPSVDLIDPTDERWASALDRVVHDVYATPAYVTAEALRLQAEPVGCLVDEGGRLFLLPLLLRRFGANGSTKDAVSPYGYPGIVLNEAAAATEDFPDLCVTACLDALRDADVCSAFVRLHPLLNAPLDKQLTRHPLTEEGLTVSIDLALPVEHAWAAVSRGHHNAINRANRAGFRVEIYPARQWVDEFAAVYADTLQRVGASEFYHFSDEDLARLAAMNEAFVAVAYSSDDAVAGAYLIFESHGFVQMHLGGRRTEFRKPSPSHLMIHAIAQWARERGNSIVHLGGGVGAAIDDSLFTFKAGFSPSRHPYRTLRLIADEERYDALIQERARRVGTSTDELLSSGFFPAYRATPDLGA